MMEVTESRRRVLLSGVVGSTAYGLNTEGSDVARLGIFAVPSLEFGSLAGPGPESVFSPDLNRTIHEAVKFVRLALSCNPTVSELLWLPEYETSTALGEELVAVRGELLSAKRVRDAYLGYATQQFRKLHIPAPGTGVDLQKTRRITAKHARHLMRLCWQGGHLHRTGELRIRVDDPQSFHDFGERVAGGDTAAAAALMARYEALFDERPSVLPDQPNRELAERWLRRVRVAFLDHRAPRAPDPSVADLGERRDTRIHVTRVQKRAAEIIVERSDASGRPVRPAVRKIAGAEPAGADGDKAELRALDDSGEMPSGKRCAFCGAAITVLEWRPASHAVSTPMASPSWFPTMPVREAKFRCLSCSCLSYGLLVDGRLDELDRPAGHFVVLPLGQVSLW